MLVIELFGGVLLLDKLLYLLKHLLAALLGNGLFEVIVDIIRLFVFFELIFKVFYPFAKDSLDIIAIPPDLLDSMMHVSEGAMQARK